MVMLPMYHPTNVPSKPKKTGTFGTFFGRQPTIILKIGTCIFYFLDAISFTGKIFTKDNLNFFLKMYGRYFHD